MSETTCHLVAGGAAGTVGAILTSPLEVIKTRLQSSRYQYLYNTVRQAEHAALRRGAVVECVSFNVQGSVVQKIAFFRQPVDCLKDIIKNEGIRGLYKGLTPTIFGVAPTRAIFFFAYQNCKARLSSSFDADTSLAHFYTLHGLSASIAGFTTLTLTNPIWLVKTRLQLDNRHNSVLKTIQHTWTHGGIRGFYKGITASYLGIGETVMHIVIYEELKRLFIGSNSDSSFYSVSSSFEMLRVLAVSATSKTIATSVMYPHEVLRTRLRQTDNRYKNLRQALVLMWREEGWLAFYRGLQVHILRQVPNAAITMSVYELVVSCLKQSPSEPSSGTAHKGMKFVWPFKSKAASSGKSDAGEKSAAAPISVIAQPSTEPPANNIATQQHHRLTVVSQTLCTKQ